MAPAGKHGSERRAPRARSQNRYRAHPPTLYDGPDDSVHGLELAVGVEQLGAIQPQRVAHAPSEPEVHPAGLFAEPLGERREKLVVGRRLYGQRFEIPFLVARDSRPTQRLRELDGIALEPA